MGALVLILLTAVAMRAVGSFAARRLMLVAVAVLAAILLVSVVARPGP